MMTSIQPAYATPSVVGYQVQKSTIHLGDGVRKAEVKPRRTALLGARIIRIDG